MPDPGEAIGICVLLPPPIEFMISLDWMLFMAGRILGKIVEFYWRSVPAWVSSTDLWWRESPAKKSDLRPANLIVSDEFFKEVIYFKEFVF